MRIIILYLLVVGPMVGHTQSIVSDTIEWTSNEFLDLNTNVTVVNSCQFVTQGTSGIKWIQNNGNLVLNWTVLETEGTLDQVPGNGTRTLRFADGPLRGELTILQTGSDTKMNLTLTGGPSDFHIRYTITVYRKL